MRSFPSEMSSDPHLPHVYNVGLKRGHEVGSILSKTDVDSLAFEKGKDR